MLGDGLSKVTHYLMCMAAFVPSIFLMVRCGHPRYRICDVYIFIFRPLCCCLQLISVGQKLGSG